MSDFSPILVLQIKIRIKPDRHGKGSNKIWETHSFWRNFFNNGAIWLQTLICNRLNPWYEMQAVWLSIQRNHPFAYERLFLRRLMHRGCHLSSDVPSLASSDTGKTYNFSTADKLNTLLLNCLLSIRQLKISVPAKWVRTSRQYVLNIYSCNNAYADVLQNDFG